jgi:hypothetical protein
LNDFVRREVTRAQRHDLDQLAQKEFRRTHRPR